MEDALTLSRTVIRDAVVAAAASLFLINMGQSMTNPLRHLEFPPPMCGDGGPQHSCGTSADWIGWVVWAALR